MMRYQTYSSSESCRWRNPWTTYWHGILPDTWSWLIYYARSNAWKTNSARLLRHVSALRDCICTRHQVQQTMDPCWWGMSDRLANALHFDLLTRYAIPCPHPVDAPEPVHAWLYPSSTPAWYNFRALKVLAKYSTLNLVLDSLSWVSVLRLSHDGARTLFDKTTSGCNPCRISMTYEHIYITVLILLGWSNSENLPRILQAS